jgi:hypothetical protein
MSPEYPTYTLTHHGQWLSLNQVYGKSRWLASVAKNEWKTTFTRMFTEAGISPFLTFKITIRYNSRMDADNVVAGNKVLVDTLREMKLVPNDDKRYYKGISIEPDASLKHNQYVIIIHVLSH